MAEANYIRKAVEEVYRLADERVASIDSYLTEKNNEYSVYCKDSEVTTAEINEYFQNLAKQLERWKQHYNQIVADAYRKQDKQYLALRDELMALSSKLHIPHEKRRNCTSQSEANDTIFTIHNTLAKVEEVKQSCDEFISQCCVSLRFVGKLNLEELQRDDIGTVEFLADSACAEILPINVPRVKLGGLFHVNFRLTRSHCPASKKHVSHKVTRDDNKTGERTKIMSYLFDQKDGKFSLGFPITSIVPHTVTIEYMGKNIKNSPYTIVFKASASSSSSNALGDTNNSNAMCLKNVPSVKEIKQEDFSEDPFEENEGDDSKIIQNLSFSNIHKQRHSTGETNRPLGRRLSRFSLIPSSACEENKENGSSRSSEISEKSSLIKEKSHDNIFDIGKNRTFHDDSSHYDENSSDANFKHSPSFKISNDVTSPVKEETNSSSEFSSHERSTSSNRIPLKVANGKLKVKQIHELKNELRFPIGCGSGPDNEVFICDTGHGRIHHYDSEYVLKQTIGRQVKMHRPSKCLYDVKDNLLLVKDDRDIYGWDLRIGDVVRRFEVRPRSNLYGLMMCEDTHEVITLEANTSTLHFLSASHPNDRRTESYAPLLQLSPAERTQSKCRFMDFNSNGDIVCSDLGMSRIYLTSITGEQLNVFGGSGSSPGMFFEPSGVSSDMAGHVLIADSKHNRIQVFDDIGNYVGLVESDERNRRPSDILLARDNTQLLVMNYLDHLVKVYKI